jgi:hypothetical protein
MGPLDANARREGHKAMEKSLTAAARVGRRLRAGRPRAILNEPLDPLQAIHRLVGEANKARDVMKQEGLDPNDIRCGLIYRTPEVPDQENFWHCKWLPPLDETKPTLEQTKPFFDWFLELALKTNILFLGLLWRQVDREANPGGLRVGLWLTPFLTGPKEDKLLLAAKAHYEREISVGTVLDN